MRKKILLILIYFSCSFGNDFCVFDANGNCMSNLHDMREVQNLFQEKGFKKYYIASNEKSIVGKRSYKSVKPTRSSDHKRWYEVDWNQGVKFCPEKNFNTGNGTWVVNASAHIDSTNCLYVDGSPYTRSILVLYARNMNDLTDADSSWILVNQTIVELSKSKHLVWKITKLGINLPRCSNCYEPISFDYDLIVDKTEFTLREARALISQYCSEKKRCKDMLHYEKYDFVDTLKFLDYPANVGRFGIETFAEWRSKRDGLKTAFPIINQDSTSGRHVLSRKKNEKYSQVLDLSKNGYRPPLEEEWQALQRCGQASDFFWGNDETGAFKYVHTDNITKDYIHKVGLLEPNPCGLYDVYGNADEKVLIKSDANPNEIYIGLECRGFPIGSNLGSTCFFQKKIRITRTGFQGFRLVRKLE